MLSISANSNPSNVYSDKVFCSIFHFEEDNEYFLKEWYEKAITEANKQWIKYMEEEYLMIE